MENTGHADTSQVSDSVLSLRGISKSFDGVSALDDASFDLNRGEMHALLGENGAGKSTLMNVACGLYTPDSGTIFIGGAPANIPSPADATKRGLGMVHQHYKLVGPFTVAENILLSCGSILNIKTVAEAADHCKRAAADTGFDINPDARTDALSVAERQRVEITKLILRGADVLILDEPTAVLTDTESDAVLSLMRSIVSGGKSVVLITHRLREVRQYADRVTIMRAGRTVSGASAAHNYSESQLAELMVGGSLPTSIQPPRTVSNHAAGTRLSLSEVSVTDDGNAESIDNITLNIKGGQITGIAGVGGNGQTALAEVIAGLIRPDNGKVMVDDVDVTRLSIAEHRQRGIKVIPSDRFAYALIGELRAYENLALPELSGGKFGNLFWLSRRRMKQSAAALFERTNILGGNPTTLTRLFSGGNAQKLLLARELGDDISVLIAHSPTRGLDVRACQSVHSAILACVERGTACLLISEDLDEVLALSNQIAVIHRGKLQGPWPTTGIDRTRIGELMSGHV